MRNRDEVVPWSMAAVKVPRFLGCISAGPSSWNSVECEEPMRRVDRLDVLSEANMEESRESGRWAGGA